MIHGTDYNYVNEDSINPFLKCKLCSKPFVNPVIKTDDSRVCRSCIYSNNENVIPVQEKLLLDLLDDIRVECIKCKELNIRRGDFEQHINTTCSHRLVPCKAADLKCSWIGSYVQLNHHLESCPFQLLRPIFTEFLADIRQFKEQQTQDYRIRNDELKKEVDELRQRCNRLQTEFEQLKTQSEQVLNENLLLKQEINRISEFEKQFEQFNNRQINQNNELQIEQFIQQNNLYTQLQTEFNQYKQNNEIQQISQCKQFSENIINYTYIRQLVDQHDVQIKLLARKKCIIPGKSINELFFLLDIFILAVTTYSNIKLEQLIEESITNSEIDLDEKQLFDHDMDVVYKKVIIDKKCTKLRLQKNRITGKGATILANALYNNMILTELYLSKNQISDIGVHSLAQKLSMNNSTLKLLDLHSNNITDEGAEYLAEMLKINKVIIRLGLGFNQISDQGVRLLANTMTYYNENLQWLSLSFNRLISDTSVNYLIEMLTYNPSLKTLWLNDCNLSTNAAALLKQEVALKKNFTLEI